MRTFSLDMIPGGAQTAVACNQYESGDTWVFALYYDGGRYEIPADAEVSITGTKPDGAAYKIAGTVESNAVQIVVTDQITACAGRSIAEILVEADGTVLYSANFPLLVEPAAVQGDLSPSEIPAAIVDADGNVYIATTAGGGQPKAITLASQMTDEDQMYVYLGSETGYSYGYIYAYLNGAWTATTLYGVGQPGPDGQPGADGRDGTDGYSPVATVTQTETGVAITVTDKDGTTTANVSNGTATDAQVAAWLDNHPEATTTVEDGAITAAKLSDDVLDMIAVDDTLLEQGKAADAKAVGDAIDSVKDDLTGVESLFVISNNLFDKDDADIVLDSEIAANGTISEKSNYFVSGFIPVEYGKTYTLSYPSNTYGSNSRVVTYNANKERIGYRNASARATASPYRITFTADAQSASYPNTDVTYVRYTGYTPYIDSYRFVEGMEYPEYMPYGVKQLASDVNVTADNIGVDFKVSAENTTFIGVASKNLLDVDAMVVGDLSNQAGNANVLPQNTGYLTTDFIPVEGGKTYALYAPVFHYGVTNYRGVPCYSTNKEFIGYVLPNQTLAAESLPCTITIPTGTAYIRNCYPKTQNNWKQKYYLVIYESNSVPDGTYFPYQADAKLTGAGIEDEYAKVYNPLIGKLAVWDGDSICAADNDSLGGWPMRIASDNHMRVKSYAVSGATITSNTSASHWISTTIDTIAEAYPDADYIVIDGGTNDADQLRDVEGGIGTFDADDFSAEYIAALDKDTFSGALEYVFYKMVTVWKGKHLGYIIPQKMGTGSAAVAGRITFFNRAREIAAKWGIPVIDLWNDYYFNWRLVAHYDPSLSSDGNNEAGNLYRDGQHLTDTGYAIQSPVIAEWMKGI